MVWSDGVFLSVNSGWNGRLTFPFFCVQRWYEFVVLVRVLQPMLLSARLLPRYHFISTKYSL